MQENSSINHGVNLNHRAYCKGIPLQTHVPKGSILFPLIQLSIEEINPKEWECNSHPGQTPHINRKKKLKKKKQTQTNHKKNKQKKHPPPKP